MKRVTMRAAVAVAGTALALPTLATRLVVRHIGGWRRPDNVPRSKNADTIAIAAAPKGRLWVAWENDVTDRVYASLTNRKATRFGAVRVVKSAQRDTYRLAAYSGAVRVRVAGKSKVTNGKGKVRIVFRKGFRPGRYQATAAKGGFAKGHVTIRVRQ